MKKLTKGNTQQYSLQYYSVLVLLLLAPFMTLIAQQDVKINGREVGSWFDRNWIWVAGVVLILLVAALAGRGSKRRKVTTVLKDDMGNVKSVTTTEVKE